MNGAMGAIAWSEQEVGALTAKVAALKSSVPIVYFNKTFQRSGH